MAAYWVEPATKRAKAQPALCQQMPATSALVRAGSRRTRVLGMNRYRNRNSPMTST